MDKQGNRIFTMRDFVNCEIGNDGESTRQTVKTVSVKSSSTAIAQLSKADIFVSKLIDVHKH